MIQDISLYRLYICNAQNHTYVLFNSRLEKGQAELKKSRDRKEVRASTFFFKPGTPHFHYQDNRNTKFIYFRAST
jgi:hypothetical protein